MFALLFTLLSAAMSGGRKLHLCKGVASLLVIDLRIWCLFVCTRVADSAPTQTSEKWLPRRNHSSSYTVEMKRHVVQSRVLTTSPGKDLLLLLRQWLSSQVTKMLKRFSLVFWASQCNHDCIPSLYCFGCIDDILTFTLFVTDVINLPSGKIN